MDKRTIARKRKINEYVKGYKFGRFDLDSDLKNNDLKCSKVFKEGYFSGKFHKKYYDEDNYANRQRDALLKFLTGDKPINSLEQKTTESEHIPIVWLPCSKND